MQLDNSSVTYHINLLAYIKYNDLHQLGNERMLTEEVCFCPVRIFTRKSLEIAISCWEWLLVARKDLEDEVSIRL